MIARLSAVSVYMICIYLFGSMPLSSSLHLHLHLNPLVLSRSQLAKETEEILNEGEPSKLFQFNAEIDTKLCGCDPLVALWIKYSL